MQNDATTIKLEIDIWFQYILSNSAMEFQSKK